MLKKLINELRSIKHNPNTFADKKHENAVKDILLNNGLSPRTKLTDKEKQKLKNKKIPQDILEKNRILSILRNTNNILTIVEEFKNEFFFIEQPNGPNDSPDFIVCYNGLILWLECKSAENGNNLMWNSGYPRKNVLYIFSCKESGNTTLFLGQNTEIQLNNSNFENDYQLFDEEVKRYADELFRKMFPNCNEFSYYNRRMLNNNTNYDTENLREYHFDKIKTILNIC